MKKIPLLILSLLLGSILSAQPLGSLSTELKARDAYRGQCAYMDFYHGLSLSQEGVDISLSGLLSIDGVIPAGPVFEEDIRRLYPFPNTLTVLRMSGEEIRLYLEASYASWAGPEGLLLKSRQKADGTLTWNFLHSPAHFDSAAGIDYTVDLSKPEGERVRISALADGGEFKADAFYNVALTHFRASGAGKLLQAAGLDPKDLGDRVVSSGKPFRDILREYLSAEGTLDPSRMSRGHWSFVPEEAVHAIDEGLTLIFGL